MSEEPPGELRDYLDWHDAYDRLGSSLHLRLLMVQEFVAAAFDEAPPGPIRVLSLCAGQGRDVITVAQRHRRGGDVVGRLVELDPRNVEIARALIADAGLSALEVLEADAADTAAYVGAAPADVVLACGIFGNITDEEVERTIRFLPAVCAPDAWAIWTRVPRGDDILERIDGWFVDAGFESRAVVVGKNDIFGAGAAQYRGDTQPLDPALHLFDFFR
jgi:SAM-dependent methyltransferase